MEDTVNSKHGSKMLKSTAVLCVLSILLCFNLNYTFPYNRGTSKWNIFHGNSSNYCVKNSSSVGRTKKMASTEGNTLKIIDSTTIRTTTTTVGPTTATPASTSQRKTNINRKSATKDEDLTHYEQMVIMKKNPYLDLKELEQKLYYSGTKKARASVSGASGGGVAGDVGICDEGPYVEIINRGLSGFAIPTKLMKSAGVAAGEDKSKEAASLSPAAAGAAAASINDNGLLDGMITKKTEKEDMLLSNLVKDIKKFEESKLIAH